MKADLSRQWRLLDLQALDTRLAQLAHRAATLPVIAELERASGELERLEQDAVLAETAVGDVDREIAKAEQDVQLVRDRAARNTARLESGQGPAKELQALQHELELLAHRQSDLEDVELEVMERAEQLRADRDRARAARETSRAEVTRLGQERDAALAEVEREREQVARDRDMLAPGLGADLVGLYETCRERYAGVGAAALVARRCTGCGLELNAAEVARVRAAAEDEVLRCEECGRILVRTAESGL